MSVEKGKIRDLAQTAINNAPHDDDHYNSQDFDRETWHRDLITLAHAVPPEVVMAMLDENERLEAAVSRSLNLDFERRQEIDQLKAEIEALRKDAERYRWLRDSSESIHQFYLSTPIWFTGVKFNKDNVDRTIDAAMGKESRP